MQVKERQSTLWRRTVTRADVLGQSSYLRYLGAMWRSTAAFGWYSAAQTLFRRIRLLRLIFRGLHIVLLLLETGTVFLLLLPALLVALAGALLMLLGGLIELWRLRQSMIARMTGKKVIFLNADIALFESEQQTDTVFYRQLVELGAHDNILVIVRSPYLFSSRGFGGKVFYLSQRREGRRIYLVRTFAYFALRRTARQVAERVIWVI